MTTVPDFLTAAKGYKGTSLDDVLKNFNIDGRVIAQAIRNAVVAADEQGVQLAQMLQDMSKTQRLKAAKTFAKATA